MSVKIWEFWEEIAIVPINECPSARQERVQSLLYMCQAGLLSREKMWEELGLSELKSVTVKCEKPTQPPIRLLEAQTPGVHPAFGKFERRRPDLGRECETKTLVWDMVKGMDLKGMLKEMLMQRYFEEMLPPFASDVKNPCAELALSHYDGLDEHMDVTARSICEALGTGPGGEDDLEVRLICQDLAEQHVDFAAVVERLRLREHETLASGGYTGRYREAKRKALADPSWTLHAEMAVAERALKMWEDSGHEKPTRAVAEAISMKLRSGIHESKLLMERREDAQRDLARLYEDACPPFALPPGEPGIMTRTEFRPDGHALIESLADVQPVHEAAMEWFRGSRQVMTVPATDPREQAKPACEHDFIVSYQTGKPWCKKCGETK